MLFLIYGQSGEMMGDTLREVKSIQEAQDFVASRSDIDFACILERDSYPAYQEIIINEFQLVYDKAGGWRPPNLKAQNLQETWEQDNAKEEN